MIEAINVVTEFLLFFQNTTDHRQPLTHLLNALLSLEKGDVLPLLKLPTRRSGRRPASPARNCDKAMAVATASRLQEIGLGREVSYSRVAQTCREAGFKPGRGRNPQVTARTVLGWKEEIDADVGRHSEAAQTFDLLGGLPSWVGRAIESKGAEATRNALLEGLRRSLVQMRAPEH